MLPLPLLYLWLGILPRADLLIASDTSSGPPAVIISISWTKILERIPVESGILETISSAFVFFVGNGPIQSSGNPSFICLDLPGFSEGSNLKWNLNLVFDRIILYSRCDILGAESTVLHLLFVETGHHTQEVELVATIQCYHFYSPGRKAYRTYGLLIRIWPWAHFWNYEILDNFE